MATATLTPKAKKPKTKSTAPAAATAVMTDDLRGKIPEIQSKVDKLTDTDLEIRREIGELLIEIIDDTTGKYGTDPEKAIAAVMPLSADSIRPMVRFARNYTRPEVDRLKAMRNTATGERLTWSHIIALTRVPDKDKAFALAERAVEEGLSTKSLVREVMAAAGGRKSKGGRKPKSSQTFTGSVADITAKCVGLKNNLGVWMASKGGIVDQFNAFIRGGHVPSQAELDNLTAAITHVDETVLQMRNLAQQMSTQRLQAAAARARTQKLAG